MERRRRGNELHWRDVYNANALVCRLIIKRQTPGCDADRLSRLVQRAIERTARKQRKLDRRALSN
jgi:hypothetical protein